MAKYYSLFGGTTTDTEIQVAKENQIVISEGPGAMRDRLVIYKVEHDANGYMYHLVNLETKAIRRTDILRPYSRKFGIGMYYTDAPAEFMDAFEVAALVAEAEQKAKDEADAKARAKTEHDRIAAIGAELRKAAANLPETAYLAEYNKDYELRYSGFTLGKSPSYGWSIHKMTHYTREGFIDALAYIAGDENNIRLSSPKPERTPEQEQGQTTVQGDFILVNYSEKAIALFGDTKPIKDALSDLGGRFNGRLTYRGEKCAGWIFPKAKEMQVRELIGMAE